MSKLRINDLESLDTGASVGVDVLAGVPAELDRRVIYVDTIADLQALPTSEMSDGQQVNVAGFYSDTKSGGGLFTWESLKDKAEHDGGTIIDPTNTWDGTRGGLSGLLNWSASGQGCFVRVYDNLCINFFGATTLLADCSESMSKAIEVAPESSTIYLLPDTDGGGTFKFPSGVGQVTKDISYDFCDNTLRVGNDFISFLVSGENKKPIVLKNGKFLPVDAGITTFVDLIKNDAVGTRLENLKFYDLTGGTIFRNVRGYGVNIERCEFRRNHTTQVIRMMRDINLDDSVAYSINFRFVSSDITGNDGVGIVIEGGDNHSILNSVVESCGGGGVTFLGHGLTHGCSIQGTYLSTNTGHHIKIESGTAFELTYLDLNSNMFITPDTPAILAESQFCITATNNGYHSGGFLGVSGSDLTVRSSYTGVNNFCFGDVGTPWDKTDSSWDREIALPNRGRFDYRIDNFRNEIDSFSSITSGSTAQIYSRNIANEFTETWEIIGYGSTLRPVTKHILTVTCDTNGDIFSHSQEIIDTVGVSVSAIQPSKNNFRIEVDNTSGTSNINIARFRRVSHIPRQPPY